MNTTPITVHVDVTVSTLAYELRREAALAWGWLVTDGRTEVVGRTWTRRGALARIADHLALMREAGDDAAAFAAVGAVL